jgi:two-component system cell cycle response regulator
MVARMGGEEFIVVLPDAPREIVISVAERLRNAMADNPFKISDPKVGELTVTISIGAVLARPGEDTPEDLMRFADEALYAAKGEGRNRVVSVFESEFKPPGKSAAG